MALRRENPVYWKVRANDFERGLVKQIADREGIRTSEALRLCVREAARQYGLWPVRSNEQTQSAE